MLAKCPQSTWSQLLGNLVKTIQNHGNFTGSKQGGRLLNAILAGKKGISLLELRGEPVLGTQCPWVPSMQSKYHRHRHLGPFFRRDAFSMFEGGEDE